MLVALPLVVAGLASAGRDEPRALSEFLETMTPGGGVFAAFPGGNTPFASDFMKQLSQAVPIPLLVAAWHVVFGAMMLGCGALLRRRAAGRLTAEGTTPSR